MSRVIELGYAPANATAAPPEAAGDDHVNPFSSLRGMLCQSVGPVKHEVSVPFHDSQVRGIALLIQTGWDQHWGTDAYWKDGPFLGEHLIFRCVRSGIRVIGIDFPIGDRSGETRLITTGDIAVVENLHGLESLPRIGFRFTAIPLRALSGKAVPVHAFAEII